jgi:hypothetical protein
MLAVRGYSTVRLAASREYKIHFGGDCMVFEVRREQWPHIEDMPLLMVCAQLTVRGSSRKILICSSKLRKAQTPNYGIFPNCTLGSQKQPILQQVFFVSGRELESTGSVSRTPRASVVSP